MKIVKNDFFLKDLSENIAIHQTLVKLNPIIKRSINLIYLSIKKGGKIMFCGNGGSAADSQHLAAELLIDSIASLNEGEAWELVAENLRSAHHHLGDILRPMSSDDLLGEIFSEFCIGK